MRAVLIDDEKHCLKILATLLASHCPSIDIVAQFQDPREALTYLSTESVDIVFLDIEMPKLNGFELIDSLGEVDFEIIFTTAFDEYAIKAFKVSASDYLLKPIDEDELVKAVTRAQSRQNASNEQIRFLLEVIQNQMGENIRKIAVPSSKGLDFIEVDSILYCSSDGNYSRIHGAKNPPKLVSRTLKEIQEMLPDHKFVRVHNSYLVNLDYVEKYIRTDGGYLVMANGDKVKVSRQKKAMLIGKF